VKPRGKKEKDPRKRKCKRKDSRPLACKKKNKKKSIQIPLVNLWTGRNLPMITFRKKEEGGDGPTGLGDA